MSFLVLVSSFGVWIVLGLVLDFIGTWDLIAVAHLVVARVCARGRLVAVLRFFFPPPPPSRGGLVHFIELI